MVHCKFVDVLELCIRSPPVVNRFLSPGYNDRDEMSFDNDFQAAWHSYSEQVSNWSASGSWSPGQVVIFAFVSAKHQGLLRIDR